MRGRDEAMLTEILPAEERAVEDVVARYQRVSAAVTRFARSLADDDLLRVRLGSRTSASPGEIVMDPGVFQAAYARRAPVTPTEVALASALHEVIHLVVTDLDEARPLPAEWFPEHEEPLPDTPVPLLEAVASAGGPAGEALFLAVEDARQEHHHLSAYPGARSVLSDLYRASITGAMEAARPLGQFALAAFLAVGGYDDVESLQTRAQPAVAAALDDADDLLAAARHAADPWEAAGAALGLLAVARRHGLLTGAEPGESRSERAQRYDDERSAIEDGVDAVRIITPILHDADSYDSARQSTQGAESEHGRHADSDVAGDPATDQILRVSEGADVYLPTGQSGKLIVAQVPSRFASLAGDGRDAIEEAAERWSVAQRHISGELYPLFVANQRRGLRSGYDAGDLSPHAALFLGAGLYQRMFERRSLPSRRAYAVSLLVDGSASMLQPRPVPNGGKAPWAMAAASLGAWTLARLCDELQVEFEVALFNRAFAARTEDTERSYVDRLNDTKGALRRTQGGAADRLTRTVNHYLIKSFDDRWASAEGALAGLFWTAAHPGEASIAARRDPSAFPPVSMFEKAANVDELNVSHAAERLASRHAQVRMLVVLADGMTRGSVETLATSVAAVEASGTTVLGVGIGDATVEAAYGRSEVVGRPESLTGAMIEGVRGALRRSIAESGGDTWWGHEASTEWRSEVARSR